LWDRYCTILKFFKIILDKSCTVLIIGSMKIKNEKNELPIIGGSVIEIGKFVYNMIVILSDHKDPKDQETVVFQYHKKEEVETMRETVMKDGVKLKVQDKGIEVEIYYGPQVVRKIIVRKEPFKDGYGPKVLH